MSTSPALPSSRVAPILLVMALLMLLGMPAPVAGQGDDFEDPTISISPSGGTYTSSSRYVTITWCDNLLLNHSSRIIKHNGVTVTSNFSYSSIGGGCYNSSDTITLTAGSNSVYAYICDASWLCTSKTVYYTYDEGMAEPVVTAVSQQMHRSPALCGEGCADFVMTYSTPAYRSLDQDRSTTLLYRSDQARPLPMVLLEVQDTSSNPADTISVRLKRKWSGAWQTLHTGGTEVYYDNPNTSNHTSIVAVGVDADGLATGAYDFTAYVYNRWSGGQSRETQSDVRVLVVNEKDSPYGWGWTVAGVHRVHTQVLGGSSGVAVTDGSGAVAFLADSCTTQGGHTECLYTEPVGWVGDLEYDTWFSGYRYRRQYPDGSEMRFDASGLMTSLRDRYGNVTTYAYDGSARLTSITDPAGKVTTFGYGTDSKLAWIKDPANRQSTVTINGSYDVTQIQDPASGKPLQGLAYSSHRMTVYKDRANAQWDVAYDFAGRIDSIRAPSVKIHTGSSVRPATRTESLESSLMDAASSLASPGANRTSADLVVLVRDPELHETTFSELASFGQPEKIEMERGRVARVLYNIDGRVTREVSPTGDSISYTWTSDRLTQTTYHATGQAVLYEYTSYDNVSRVYGTGLPDTRHYYYSNGAPKYTTINGDTVVTYAAADSKGRPTTVTDAEGYTTVYAYGTGFQNREQVTAGGQSTRWRYDSYGRLRHTINGLWDTVTVNYDAINRVTSVNDEAGGVTSYGYSSMYRTSVTDPRSEVYSFYPNALGWDTTVVDPANKKEKYKYDKDGAVRTYVNRRSQTVSHVYNEAHELTSTTAGGQTTTFTISADLLTRTASNAHSTDTITYNKYGQVEEEISRRDGIESTRFQVLRDYDTQMRFSEFDIKRNGSTANSIDYLYNAAGQLSTVMGTSIGSTIIGYDPRFNAETFRWTLSGDTLYLKHPSVGAPGELRYSDAAVNDFAGRQYVRDPLRRVSERWVGDFSVRDEYERNALGHITSVETWQENNPGGVECSMTPSGERECEQTGSDTLLGSETFSWDAVGNPSGETVNAGNRLATLGSISLTYDLDGNITKRTGGGETIDFWWNSLNQLDSANSSVNGKIRYKYDGFGRRVSTNDAVGTTRFLWDGQNMVADIDGSGNLLRYYNYYPGGLSNLHSLRVGSSAYLYVKDVTGNVLGLLNSSGNKVNDYAYSAFGELTDVNETVANRFRFASGEQDRLGLYYFRARYYEPEFMRFLSEDPIGLAGGINQYVYAGNNPVDLVDRSGLCPEEDKVDGVCPIEIEGPGDVVVSGGDILDKRKGESDDFLDRGPIDIPTIGPTGPGGGNGPPSLRAVLGISPCMLAIGLFAGNVVASGVTVGWVWQAYRAKQMGRLAGAAPAFYNAIFRANLREAVAINVMTPGGIWNSGTGGVTVFQDPSLRGVLKAFAGFTPVGGAIVSGIDMVNVCGWN